MVLVDTSAWIEYFRNGAISVGHKVDRCLRTEDVAIGDLIYCEIMQGIYLEAQRKLVEELFVALPQFDLVGFAMANKAATNYRLLRSKGVTVRKTIDVLIGTFCVEHDMALIHNDRDFDLMAKHIVLKVR